MSTNVAKPGKVAIIGARGTYGTGIPARAEEIGVEAVVITRSPHKFKEVKPTTTVVEAQLDEEEKLKEALTGCDGVISALGDDRTKRPKAHNLPHVWNAMKAAGVTKYIGMGSGAMMMPGEKRGIFQLAVQPALSVLKLFGVDLLEQIKQTYLFLFSHTVYDPKVVEVMKLAALADVQKRFEAREPWQRMA